MLKYNCQKFKNKKLWFVEIFTNLELFRNTEQIAKTLRYYLQLFMEDITMYITGEDLQEELAEKDNNKIVDIIIM